MSSNKLNQIMSEHDGKMSDKWSAYLNAYENVLAEYQNLPVRLLEVGVQNGGSLEIWEKYFSDLVALVGCDINPETSQLEFNNPRINVVVGDIKLKHTQEQIHHFSKTFNIIIDDGSHHSDDIISTFAHYFPVLELDGLYIVEDLHCSYWEEFRGGIFEPMSSLSFFKRLVDINNFDHWGVKRSRVEHLSSFTEEYGCEFDEEELKTIHSVEFMNSMCIIRKKDPQANELGRRIFSGKSENVVCCADEYADTILIPPDQGQNNWSSPLGSIEDQLKKSLGEVDSLTEQNAVLSERLNVLRQTLLECQTSTSWKLTRPLLRFFKNVIR